MSTVHQPLIVTRWRQFYSVGRSSSLTTRRRPSLRGDALSMPRRGITDNRVRIPILVATAAMIMFSAGCGLLGAENTSAPANPSPGGLEKPNLKISVMTTTDLAPFHLAVKNGYFRDAGFTFDPVKDVSVAKSGGDSVAKLTAKE